MRRKEWKEILKEGFEAPAPVRKEAFIGEIPKSSIGYPEFLLTQASYIRRRSWGIFFFLFGVFLVSASYLGREMLWCLSAFTPFLAVSVITESGRSERYGMAEFEMAARFSLKSVVLARLGMLGMIHFVFFLLLVPFASVSCKVNMMQTGVYMACPYLLTAFCGCYGMRRVHGREAGRLCLGIAAFVSMGCFLGFHIFPAVYAEGAFIWWLVVLLLSGVGTGKQCYQIIKQTEELAWNL